MKINYLFTTILICLISHSFINASSKVFTKGYVIKNNGDTTFGYLNNKGNLYVKFKENDSSKVFSYDPSEIKGYMIRNQYFESHKIDNMNFFFMVLSDCQIILYYCPGDFASPEYMNAYYYMDRKDNELVMISRKPQDYLNFLKLNLNLNDSVIETIKNDYIYSDLPQLIKQYCISDTTKISNNLHTK